LKRVAQFHVSERSQTAEVRRYALQFANSAGLDEHESGKVGIAATELAGNLINYAQGGEILVSADSNSVDVLSIDRGPGMNLEACLRDGFSTAGTAGTGLGAVRRLASAFDAYSTASGTVLICRFGAYPLNLGYACAPMKGEPVCGDSWSVVDRQGARWILVSDGLGHGEFAAEASRQAVEIFEASRLNSVAEVIEEIHLGLRSTRGAAIAVAQMLEERVEYCGLGNISGAILSGSASTHMVSMAGTAGVQARKFSPFTYALSTGAVVVMHSDGVQAQWSLDKYPGVLRYDPAILAGLLYRDYNRGRDDVTVLVVRQ
jgi:anti-sigma regulatory factor (Ser/Thr protein kinase)